MNSLNPNRRQPGGDPYVAIVFAGRRPGPDPVAAAFGLRARALAPVFGVPMVDRVVCALEQAGVFERIILIEDPSQEPIVEAAEVSRIIRIDQARIEPAASTAGESIRQIIDTLPSPARRLITTGDNALLTPDTVREFVRSAADSAISVGVVDRKTGEARHPGASYTYFPFADCSDAGTKLVALNGSQAASAIECWGLIEKHRRNPMRMFTAFGVGAFIGGLLRALSLKGAFARISKKVGAEVRPVMLQRPEAAIDIDTTTDLLIADSILARRDHQKLGPDNKAKRQVSAGRPSLQTAPMRTDWRDTLEAMCEG